MTNMQKSPNIDEWIALLQERERLREALKKSLERMNELDIALGYDPHLAKEVFVHMQQEVRDALEGTES